jgi:transcriptional regulator with XRE-family HTH domain
MVSINFMTPQETLMALVLRIRTKRLSFDLSQKTLSEKSGVSYGVLKKFERTGQISLRSLLKIASTLDALSDFDQLFLPKSAETVLSLDELMKDTSRKRGRK